MDVYVASTGHISVRLSSPNPSILFNSICSGSENHLFSIRIKMKTIVFNCLANGVTHESEKLWTLSTVGVYHSCFSKCSPTNFNWKKQNKKNTGVRAEESRRQHTIIKLLGPKLHHIPVCMGGAKKSTCDSAHRFCLPWFHSAALGPVWFLNLSKLVFI